MADEAQVLVTAHLEATAASLMNENNKRRLEESTRTDNQMPSTTPDVDGHLYNNNVAPPPLSDFDLAKQKAAEIAARLCGDASVKRARTDEERDGNQQLSNSTATNGPDSSVASFSNRDSKVDKPVCQMAANAQGQIAEGLGAFHQQHQQSQQSPVQAQQQQPQDSLSQLVLPPFFAQALSSQIKRMEVPNVKVGLVIGKGGETIKYLQTQSGARIQVTRDADADPRSNARSIELTGTLEAINRAEQLINDVIREAASGGSAVAVAKGLAGVTSGESVQIKIPNRKVGLIIGRMGETIKNLQNRSGARIQVQSDRETESGAMERVVTLFGNKQQTDMAEELIREVISEDRARGITPDPGFNPNHRSTSQPPASQQSAAWGQQQLPGVQTPTMQQQGQPFGYQPQTQYQMPQQQQYVMQQPYQPYSQQQPMVRGYAPGWDAQQQFIQQPQVIAHQQPLQQAVQQPQPPPQQGAVYDYYGQSQQPLAQPVVPQGPQQVGQDMSQAVHQQMHHQVPPQVAAQVPPQVVAQVPPQPSQQISAQNAIQAPAPPADGSYMYAQPQPGYYGQYQQTPQQVPQAGYSQQSYVPAQQQSYTQPQQQGYGQPPQQAYVQTQQQQYVQSQPQAYTQQQTQPQQQQQQQQPHQQQQTAAYVTPAQQQTYPQQQLQQQPPVATQQSQSYAGNNYTQDQSGYYSAAAYAAPADGNAHTGYDYSQTMPTTTATTPAVTAAQTAVEPSQ